MFRYNRNESLKTPQDRAMNNDRSRGWLVRVRRLLRRAVFQVEPLRQLEIQLDGRALERAAQRVADGDVDLGPVERTVARVDIPLIWVMLLQRFFELLP